MTYYGSKDLAASFGQVRSNTIQIAEEVPEDKYSFKASPETRSIGQALVHIAMGPGFQSHIHGNRISDLMNVNFPELHQKIVTEEAKPRTKAEIVALLKAEGDRFASYLESLSDSFLAEGVAMPPGAEPASKVPFRNAPVSKGTRDASPWAADAGAADDRSRAAPHPPDAGTDGAARCRGADGVLEQTACCAHGVLRGHQSGALVHGSSASRRWASVNVLALLRARGARSRHEVKGLPHVQDQIPRRKLAGVRASTRAARRCDAVAFCRRSRRVASFAVRSTRRAAEILGSRDQGHVDTPARLPSALAPSGGLCAVGPLLDGRRPRGARPYHAVSPESAPGRRAAPRPGQGADPSHRR